MVSAAIAAFLAIATVLACLPRMTDRDRPQAGEPQQLIGLAGRLHWLGLPLIAAAATVILRGRYWDSAWPGQTAGPLPGLATSLDVLFAATAVLLLTIAVLALLLRLVAMRGAYPEVTGPARIGGPARVTADPAAVTPGRTVATQPAWCGPCAGRARHARLAADGGRGRRAYPGRSAAARAPGKRT